MKLLHIITALNVGGAETMLAKLLEHPVIGRHPLQQQVLSLVTPGPMAARLEVAGVRVRSLGMREGIPSVSAPAQLARVVRSVRPDLIVGWMHHGQLAATIAARSLRPRPPVIWNVRHSLSDLRHEKMLSRAVLRLCASLSRGPAAIVYNSSNARTQYERFGYHADRGRIVANGFECDRYRPCADARAALMRTFDIAGEPVIVGMVARAHPMKDVETLIEAVRRVRRRGIDLHLLIAGKGMDGSAGPRSLVADALPPDRVTVAGHRTDVPAWLAGLDILAVPSAWGEGFPNVLGEAMASGVPCVATDVGDSRWIIGNTGSVVQPRDPEAMAEALAMLAGLGPDGRKQLGEKARARVIDKFSMPEIAARYAVLYDDVLDLHDHVNRRIAGADAGVLA